MMEFFLCDEVYSETRKGRVLRVFELRVNYGGESTS